MARQSNSSRVFHRSLKTDFPLVTAADGVYLIDSSGRKYLDGSGGAAVSCLGHGNRRIIDAIGQQLDSMAFAHTSFFSNNPAEKLAEILSDKAPGGAWRTYFVSGGSEANEAAMKMARQIQLEQGNSDCDHFISRRQSYHGATIATMALGDRPQSNRLYKPLLPDNIRRIIPCFEYRLRGKDESLDQFCKRTAEELEQVIEELGPGRAIAFVAETVSGATIGCVPPVPGYFAMIREICDKHKVLMILDEVMCGMGRCGSLFACEQEGVIPDMITLAKGLGGGYQPLGAVMVREELAQVIESGSGAFAHGHTYVGHATACAAGLAVQQVFEQDGLIAQVAKNGEVLAAKLHAAFDDHPHVGDIRGRGLFRGIEIVKDRDSKQPFDGSAALAANIKKQAMQAGLICYPMGGTVDGVNGDHILLAPPFIYSTAHMDELTEKLGIAINKAIDEHLATS